MTFKQQQNCLTTHFSEPIRVIKQHMTALSTVLAQLNESLIN